MNPNPLGTLLSALVVSLTLAATAWSQTTKTLVQYSKAAATGAPAAGWAFYWNAPTNWAPGVAGDLSSGAITDRASWKPLLWSGTQWTADGDNTNNNSPSSNLRLSGAGGHPGEAGTTRSLDRYAISAFTIGQAGDYRLFLGKLTTQSGGNGARVKILLNGVQKYEIIVYANQTEDFSYSFNGLASNDEIAVAVGGNGSSWYSAYELDYQIGLLKPTYANPGIVRVDDYGAVGDGVTDDVQELRSAIQAWRNTDGPCVLSFTAGKTYKLGDNTEGDAYFMLTDRKNKVVEGNGAKLLLSPGVNNRGFRITRCDNFVVQNLKMDYSPKPFAHGRLLSKTNNNDGTWSFKVESLPGYQMPMTDGNKEWGNLYNANGGGMVGGLPHFITIDKVVNNYTDRITTYTIVAANQNVEIWEFPNPADGNFVFTYRGVETGTNSVFVDLVDNGVIAFDNFHLMSAPGFGFTVEGGSTPWLARNVTIAPDWVVTDQFVSSYGDGIHCKANRYGPVIQDCYFKYVMDDAINLTGYGSEVSNIDRANDTFETPGDLDFQAGDELMFINSSARKGKATFISKNGDKIKVDVLPTSVQGGDKVFNITGRCNGGYLIDNNNFWGKRRYSALLRCGNGIVRNNLSVDHDGWWIGGGIGAEFHGPHAENILFQNNEVRNCKYGLWMRMVDGEDGVSTGGTAIRNIQILDNVFKDNPDHLYIGNVANMTILRNKFDLPMRTTIHKVENVTLGKNKDTSGNMLQNVASLLQGTHDEAELTFLPPWNLAPVLAEIGNKTVNEKSQLSFIATATDADLPAELLTFSLDAGAPTGASITPGGVFSWTPTEAQGPTTNTVTVRVSDGSASATKQFQITVNEVNVAPVLAAISDKTVNGQTLLTFTATATDADLPAQPLTFSLAAGVPAGASITTGGVFTWTPTEAQGPGTTNLGITVSDGSASSTKSFTVTVNGTPQQTWRQQYFGSVANSGDGADNADPDGDSFTNSEEYVHGTLPTTSTTNPLQFSRNGQNLAFTFAALRAEPPYYDPLTQRIYDLQTTTDLSNPASWLPVDGYSNIVGDNQTKTITLPIADQHRFFRLHVRLE